MDQGLEIQREECEELALLISPLDDQAHSQVVTIIKLLSLPSAQVSCYRSYLGLFKLLTC